MGGAIMGRPNCPKCGGDMIFFSSEIHVEHYRCPKCDTFVTVQRPNDFFDRNPFKPRIR